MHSVIRQAVAAFLLVGVAACAGAGDDKQDDDKQEKPLSPETVLEKELLGKATVEFLVDEVTTLNIDSVFKPGVSHAQIVKAKVVGAKAGQEFWMIVTRETATRMLKSGIADPAAHFRGKEVRVTGTIERFKPTGEPAKTIYKIHVSNLAQLERVQTP